MPEFPDVTGWPQALLGIGILAYLAWKAWLDSGRTKQTNETTKQTNETVNALEQTLTTNNGGGNVKDQLDRIEGGLGELGERVTALEGLPRSVDVTVHPIEIEKGTD